MGGDSAGVNEYMNLVVRADTKVFSNGPYLFGFTSSFRMGQLIRYHFKPPAPRGDLDRFMATIFINGVRKCLKAGGWAKKDSEREEGGDFLVGVSGQLFTVYSDYQLQRSALPYAAVGGGDQLALGALFATTGTAVKPEDRLLLALQAAEQFNAGVRGPFCCLSLHPPDQADEGTEPARRLREDGCGDNGCRVN